MGADNGGNVAERKKTMTEESKERGKSYNKVAVYGQLMSVRAVDGRYYHSVMTPADDRFERPQVVELRSDRRLGEPGQEVTTVGRLEGFERHFQLKNGGKGTAVTMWVDVK